MRTILNDSELEELLCNEWSDLMVEVPEARPLGAYFNEPADTVRDGVWVWSDDKYHLLVVEHGDETEWSTSDLDSLSWRLFSRPIHDLAEGMDGDTAHNVVELASIIGPACRRSAKADEGLK